MDQLDRMKQVMHETAKIRNMSVIAHVDHGKSTLSDSLVVKAGLLSREKAGQARLTDTMKMEQQKGITIKSTGVSLLFESVLSGTHLINLIDSPGHIDFSSEVSAALRVTDGALVVVDCLDGVCVQTETVLRQACAERVQAVLMINKIDRAILEKKLDGEEIYQLFVRTIDNVNVILSTYLPECLKDNLIDAVKGNVAFGSGKECWGFRVKDFAQFYVNKQGNKISVEKMCEFLWGDWFWSEEKKKFVRDSRCEQTGKQNKRGFVKFIIEPVLEIFGLIEGQKYREAAARVSVFGVNLQEKVFEQEAKSIRKTIMSQWLDVADNILAMVVEHLPSPLEAMRYRVEQLYDGPQDDEVAQSMRECNAEGPLVMYVSKMVPSKDYQKFYAFGRVFSGTLKAGQKVFVLGSGYQHGKKEDFYEVRLENPVIQMGKNFESVSEVPCGNTVALTGMDKVIKKCGTVTTDKGCYAIKNMKFTVSPVVQVAVKAKNAAELPQLIAGLTKLSKSDPLVQIILDSETNQQIICGSGELHVEVCLTLLREEFAKIEILESQPLVTYKETVSLQNSFTEIFLAKSANKLNRVFIKGKALEESLTQVLENSTFSTESQEFRDLLVQEYGWPREDTKRIWSFGPEGTPKCNLLLDLTKQCQGLSAIQDSIITGFHEAISHGVFTGEQLRGVMFCLVDAVIHSDPVHRGGAQIVPMARRAFQAAQIAAQTRVQEPVFLTEIQVPQEHKGNVYTLVSKRRGNVVDEQIVENTPLCVLKAHLPVAESFKFTDKLREVTYGTALNQCVFDHWRTLPGDAYENGSLCNKTIQEIRKRKTLKENLPLINEYFDKM